MSKQQHSLAKREVERLVHVYHNQTWTNSLIVAKEFDREHYNVLRDIRKLDVSERFKALNFEGFEYVGKQGKTEKAYRISERGFVRLVMAFTGKKAAAAQELFVEEFFRMRSELERVKAQKLNLEWQQERALGKGVRKELVTEIARYVVYALGLDSKNSGQAYTNFTTMITKALFESEDGNYSEIRDRLTAPQLRTLAMGEQIAAIALARALESGLPYKGAGGCFESTKADVHAYALLVGRTFVPVRSLDAVGEQVKALPEAASLF